MKTLISIILLYVLSTYNASAIWYGEGDNGDRTPFGKYQMGRYDHEEPSSSSITIPTNKPPKEELGFVLGLIAFICLGYYFIGEGTFQNRAEDITVRYIVLGIAIILTIFTIGRIVKHGNEVLDWEIHHQKDAAFNKIIEEESSISVIRNRAKAELNIDLDSLMTIRGVSVNTHPNIIINNNFSPVNTQNQSQTIYR